MIVCLAVAVIAAGIWGIGKITRAKREEQLARLADAYTSTIPVENEQPSEDPEAAGSASDSDSVSDADIEEPDPLEVLAEAGVPIPDKQVDFEALQAELNKDIYAWIYIPDSKIDYPILQHETDNLHYLNYNLDGSKGYPGCIYTENYNAKDFLDPVTVVYGHNMKNGTMFAGLHKYEDAEYFAEHPYVYIYTPERLMVYQVFAACVYSDKHILLNYDCTEPKIYFRFLSEITSARGMNNNYNEDVEVTVDDHVLVLSTCIANRPNNRYVVLGVLLNEN